MMPIPIVRVFTVKFWRGLGTEPKPWAKDAEIEG